MNLIKRSDRNPPPPCTPSTHEQGVFKVNLKRRAATDEELSSFFMSVTVTFLNSTLYHFALAMLPDTDEWKKTESIDAPDDRKVVYRRGKRLAMGLPAETKETST
jgi:hypothetical protein